MAMKPPAIKAAAANFKAPRTAMGVAKVPTAPDSNGMAKAGVVTAPKMALAPAKNSEQKKKMENCLEFMVLKKSEEISLKLG